MTLLGPNVPILLRMAARARPSRSSSGSFAGWRLLRSRSAPLNTLSQPFSLLGNCLQEPVENLPVDRITKSLLKIGLHWGEQTTAQMVRMLFGIEAILDK